MNTQTYISITQLCAYYDLNPPFVETLRQYGLLQTEEVNEEPCVHTDQLAQLERILRMHRDLDINLEGIDAISGLLERLQALQDEVQQLRRKLKRYEGDL